MHAALRRSITSALLAVVLGCAQVFAMAPGSTVAAESSLVSTATFLMLSPSSPLYGQPLTLTADVAELPYGTPGQAPVGSVEFVDAAATPAQSLGTATLAGRDPGISRAALTLTTGLSLGTHSLVAEFIGPDPVYATSSSDAVEVTMTKVPSTTVPAGDVRVEAHHPVPLSAYIQTSVDDFTAGATVSFHEVGSSAPGCSTAVTGALATCTISSLPVGSYDYVATYSGNSVVDGSTSAAFMVVVAPDLVHASGVGVQYTTLYPVIDSYHDTDKISGTRAEPISVAIRIQNSTGTTVRSATIVQGTGAYSYTWNGRTSGGYLLPSGTYKVTQTLTDAAGTKLVVVKSVALSHKKLYYSSTYITANGSAYNAKGTSGSGRVTVSSTGYVKLTASTTTAGWAGVGWQFTLPTATVYEILHFQVYSKGTLWAAPNEFGMQNFRTCAYSSSTTWSDDCFDHWSQLGNSTNTLTWKSTYGSATYNRSGRIARGMAAIEVGTYYVYKVRVYVTYGVLK